MNLEDCAEDGRLPIVLALADVANVDGMLTAVDYQNWSVSGRRK